MRYISLIFLLSLSAQIVAKPLAEADVPDPLKPWVNWVLFDQDKRDCPFIYNNFSEKKCAWPSSIELNISNNRARFVQSWQVFEPSWISLPGSRKHWPQNVSVNNKLALVTDRNGAPSVFVEKGKHQLRGNFFWESIPENLRIPADSALVSLYIKGVKVASPVINEQGQLWLENKISPTEATETDTLNFSVYRLLDDNIPLRVISKITIQVSGAAREVNLGQVLLDQQIPVSLNSKLPALLNNRGELRLQVKPGRWSVQISSRAKQNVTRMMMNKQRIDSWPEEEVWAFKAQNQLRVVKLEGAKRIDPRQTNMPESWRNYPTFRMTADTTLVLKQTRRGDQQPEADKLTLKRQMWLDFNGKGYTIKDEIKGTVTKSWRLETLPELQPGRVVIDNIPQFITRLEGNDSSKGVEIRRGNLNLNAVSRYQGNVQDFSATGWNHEFKTVSTTVHLPPGWRIFSASGVDNVPQTWIQKWSLLDLFIVLIISVSIARLWSWGWGLVGLITMSLIWQESGFVPQFIWLNLLAVIALLKVIPEGKLKKICIWYRNGSVVFLLLIIIPFMVSQVRTGIYPQLEKPWLKVAVSNVFAQDDTLQRRQDKATRKERRLSSDSISSGIASYSVERTPRYEEKIISRKTDIQSFDPKATIQTGPGLPQWQWNKVYLNWNGPVHTGQRVSLVLVSPTVHSVVNFLRVFFVALLGLLMLKSIPAISIPWIPGVSRVLLLLGLLPVFIFHSADSYATKINPAKFYTPDQTILDELKKRLLQPPECLPACAQIQSMVLRADKQTMQVRLDIHALQKVAIPLPVKEKQWLPSKITIDGRAAKALYRAADGVLWLELPKGRFNIMLSGALGSKKQIQLPLQLRPGIVQSKLSGWRIEGIQKDGVPDAQLQLSREKQTTTSKNSLQNYQAETLPPFLIIERTLKLGLNWFVETTVRRVSPVGSAVVVNVPLLTGESVITDGIRSKDGKVLINMQARQARLSWRSRIEKTKSITLTASSNRFSTEIWRVNVSPIWHLEYTGIPVIKHKTSQGRWAPQWQPFAGEQVILNITRPEGIKGNTLTIEKSQLQVKPGKRSQESTLNLVLRSSQGGQYSLVLPSDADLQSVKINNQSQSVRLESGVITLPITPGKQTVELIWRNINALSWLFKTPKIDLKVNNVNHSINVQFPRDRWVLFAGGPELGPAILFWGVLLVIFLIAIGLGFTRVTPLNTFSWLLLGIGLSQVPVWMGFIVVAWLFMLGLRERMIKNANELLFNVIQLAIGALTFLALISLFVVIQQGLLGSPDMQVAGNGSSAFNFNWYQDRNMAQLPQAWHWSVPLIVYRLLMLGWALWLAFSLLRWLKWGWQVFTIGGLWKDVSVPLTGKYLADKKTRATAEIEDRSSD